MTGQKMAPPRVAVLGTGTMGAPMARNLCRAGLEVLVWNRDPAKAEALAADEALRVSAFEEQSNEESR